MINEIKNPNPPEYFIVWNIDGERKHPIGYGKVEEDQWMTSGLDFIDIFINEQDWLNALAAEGIDPNEEI